MKEKRKNPNIPKIVRAEPPKNFRRENEVVAAYDQVGVMPNRNSYSWYRDSYDFFTSDEV